MEDESGSAIVGEYAELPRTLRWMFWLLGLIIGVSVVAGVAAALVGGELTDLGNGAGGLSGVPALLLAIAARLVSPGDGWIGMAVVAGAGVWVVAIGYFIVAHTVDPCVNGWWDRSSRIGSQPLCERFGSELNWHTRFHLLAHAAPAAVIFAIYVWAVRRTAIGRPDKQRTSAAPATGNG